MHNRRYARFTRLSLVLACAALLAGCPCNEDENVIRFINDSNDVIIDITIERCGFLQDGSQSFATPLFPGETRELGPFDDGCRDIQISGDLGGFWDTGERDIACGEIVTLRLEPQNVLAVDVEETATLFAQLLPSIFELLLVFFG